MNIGKPAIFLKGEVRRRLLRGMGLAGMRDRVRMLGGLVVIESTSGGGVVVEARFGRDKAVPGKKSRIPT